MTDFRKPSGLVPLTPAVSPSRIGGYRLVEPLGSGGTSSVFRAIHEETGYEVAVKVLPRYLAKNAALLRRFLREARSASALEDPRIVAIYDWGNEEGRYYMALEFIPGGDLQTRVCDNGPLPVIEALTVVRDVAQGLRHAAGRGLIHRDIKPANLLLAADGRVKIADLGLALHLEEDERVTRDGMTVGTVDYMAPEQGRDSRAASVRSDIYSLGCTFYYLLTGLPPFVGGDVAEKLYRHACEPPPDARRLRPGVPGPSAHLIQRMMAKLPEARFPDYDGLLETIDAIGVLIDGPPADPPREALIDDEGGRDDFGFCLGSGTIDEEPPSTIEAPPVAPSSSRAGPPAERAASALLGGAGTASVGPPAPRRSSR